MSDATGTPPAGWYNDPSAPEQQRWWDGTRWTSSIRPLHDAPPPALPPPTADQRPFDPSPFAGPPAAHPPQPQTHPTHVPVDPTGPTAAGPDVGGSERSSIGTAGRLAIAVAGLLTVGACAAVVGLASGDGDGDGDDTGRATTDGVVDDDAVGAVGSGSGDGQDADTTIGDSSAVDDSSGGDGSGGDGSGGDGQELGSRDEPLAYDRAVDVTWRTFGDADGSRWTTVIGPPRDITEAVLATNQFNDPPPDGVRFVGFDVSMTLVDAEAEPLSTGFSFSWELLGGSTARVYDFSTIETDSFGCGVVPDAFDDFDEVFTGGTLTGTVCVPLPVEDLGHPDTRVAMHFLASDARAVFGP